MLERPFLRDHKNHVRPYFSILQKTGTITTEAIKKPPALTWAKRPDRPAGQRKSAMMGMYEVS